MAAPTASAVRKAIVVPHGRPELIGDAAARVEAAAEGCGVELLAEDAPDVDLVVALGGDGTMLRALHRFLGTGVPVIGVNFGRIGFSDEHPGLGARRRPGAGIRR